MGITVIRISCCQPRRHLPESDGERRCLSGRNTLCSPRSALMVVSFLLQRAACDANTLFAPTVALHNPHGPLSVARGLRRQVIRARCLQPGCTTTASSNVYFGCCRTNPTTTVHVQLFLFCNCRGLQASGGASASWDSIIRPSQVLRWVPLPRFFRPWQFKLWSRAYSETATTKDLSWLLNPNQF